MSRVLVTISLGLRFQPQYRSNWRMIAIGCLDPDFSPESDRSVLVFTSRWFCRSTKSLSYLCKSTDSILDTPLSSPLWFKLPKKQMEPTENRATPLDLGNRVMSIRRKVPQSRPDSVGECQIGGADGKRRSQPGRDGHAGPFGMEIAGRAAINRIVVRVIKAGAPFGHACMAASQSNAQGPAPWHGPQGLSATTRFRALCSDSPISQGIE